MHNKTISFILLISCILTGCATTVTTGESAESSDIQVVTSTPVQEVTPSETITIDTETNTSFYYDDYLYLEGLSIKDVQSDTSYKVCSVPGCLHNTDDCPASAEVVSSYFSTIYQDKILYLDELENKLFWISTDGSQKKEIQDFSDYETVVTAGIVLVDNHLYTAVELEKQIFDEETGYMLQDSGIVRFYDIDMSNGTCTILYEGEPAVAVQVTSQTLYRDGFVVFSYENQTKRIEDSGLTEEEYWLNYHEYADQRYDIQGIEEHMIIYNLSEDSYRDVLWQDSDENPLAPSGFLGNLLFASDGKTIYSYDITDDSTEAYLSAESGYAYQIYQSADFVLFYHVEDGKMVYSILLYGEDTPRQLTAELTSNFIIDDECPTQLHLQYYQGVGDQEFDQSNSGYVSREEFKSWFE